MNEESRSLVRVGEIVQGCVDVGVSRLAWARYWMVGICTYRNLSLGRIEGLSHAIWCFFDHLNSLADKS